MLNVLLVEDNKIIATNIQRYLQLEGDKVTIAQNGLYAMEIIKNKDFDIVILDIMLPGLDGLQICKNIKNLKPNTPVIITTAKGQIQDKLSAFDLGADDYLVKPFDIQELIARIWVVLKRYNKSEVITIGLVELNRENKQVQINGVMEKFTLKEFLILEYLMINYGITLSRLEIINKIWGNDAAFEVDGKLDVYISNIRKKIGKENIETVKGYGYKFRKING